MKDTNTDEMVALVDDALGLPSRPTHGGFVTFDRETETDRLVSALNRLTAAVSGDRYAVDPTDDEDDLTGEEVAEARHRASAWRKPKRGGHDGAQT